MSKLATFSASILFASSDGGSENTPIDLGPFVSNATIPSSNTYGGIANANTVSPAYVNIVQVPSAANGFTPQLYSAGPYVTPNVYPMFFALMPLNETSGTLTVMGTNALDTGVQVSTANPSFIPVMPTGLANLANGPNPNGTVSVSVGSSIGTPVRIGWL